MVNKNYTPLKDAGHLMDWMMANCARCKRLKNPSPEAEKCKLIEHLFEHKNDGSAHRPTGRLIRRPVCFNSIERNDIE